MGRRVLGSETGGMGVYYANIENNKFALPGRLRIKVDGLKSNIKYAQNINYCLSRTEGISCVTANVYTGKVLVIFDLQKISIGEIEAVIYQAINQEENQIYNEKDGLGKNNTQAKHLSRSGILLGTAGIALAGMFAKNLFYGKSSLARHDGVFALAASTTIVTGYPALRQKVQGKEENRKLISVLNFTSFICLILRESTLGLFVAFVGLFSEFIHNHISKEFEHLAVSLLENQNANIQKIIDDRQESVQSSCLKAGDRVALKAGDFVPVDGVITQGRAMVDNTILDGKSVPSSVHSGNKLYAGTLIEEGSIIVEVTATGVDTKYYQNFSYTVQSLEKRLNAEDVFAKNHRKLVPYIVIASALGLAFTGDILVLLAILLIACPAPADFGANIAIKAAVLKAYGERVFIKRPEKLPVMSRIDSIIFDKTGTLTTAKPKVAEIIAFRENDAEFVLSIAAACEAQNRHPIAAALREESESRHLQIKEAMQYDYRPGKGIIGIIEQKEALVGNKKLFSTKNIPLREYGIYEKRFEQAGMSSLYVGYNQKIIGIIALQERVRENAALSINKLEAQKVGEIEIVSGDQEKIVKGIANQVAIKKYSASVDAQGKVQKVIDYKRKGRKVAFVGDGINDCAAMRRSDISMAFADRPEKDVFDCADIVMLDNNIEAIPGLVELSRFTMDNIEKNYKFSCALNVFGTILMLSGNFSPYFASLYKDLNSLVILTRSLGPMKYQMNTLSKQVN